MSALPYELYPNLVAEAPVPPRGIHSQTISTGNGVELVLFAFAAGEALSEHTSARSAIVHILAGEAEVTVGGDSHRLGAGAWLRMSPGLAHGIAARTPLVMALYLLPG